MLEQPPFLLSIAFLLTWVGFGLLALTQERHFSHFYPSFNLLYQWIRVPAAIGIIAVLSTFPLCIKAQGTGFGSLLWVLMLTASAMMVALQLTWAPHNLKPLAWLVKRLFHISFFINDLR